jgi:hypothetical protein
MTARGPGVRHTWRDMRKAALIGALLGAAVVVLGLLAMRRLEGERIERESHTVVEAVKKVARLATVEANVSSWQLRKEARNLFGVFPIKCEKTIAIFFRGKVAAGFDFDQPGSLDVSFSESAAGRKVRVRFPPPRILYIDAPAPELVVADGSVCNRLEPADYRKLHDEARSAVQREALAQGVLKKAEAHARELVQAVARPLGFEAEIDVGSIGSAVSVSAPDRGLR